ncbi:uncharacterized protein V1513DRAFT_445625 [Lipomyces chichibuensis]|uniref:uncharacterized protein n=1 Tax=Lipomyces chichibuensis TaxID=1546026 RepID=UPI0033441078
MDIFVEVILGTKSMRRHRVYLMRPVLLSPKKSPWQMLRNTCDEKAFILTTRLSPTNVQLRVRQRIPRGPAYVTNCA